MFEHFTSMLSAGQWAVLLAVPPAIVALYFLKLKRQPLVVPSTYLWRKSIEDLHVNSLWQRLRQSLLLFLQLLLVLLVMAALMRPSWQGARLSGGRYIFLVDNSASMNATDVKPSRLEEARRRVGELIDEMKSGDVAMLVSFADTARIEQPFTDNRGQLRRSLAAIEPTDRPTSLAEALRVAAGLANPGRSATDFSRDTMVAEALPARLYIVSDGGFGEVLDFSLGNLDPVYMPIGSAEVHNVAIVAASAQRHEQRPDRLQVFARLENFSAEPAAVACNLYLDGQLLDADQVEIEARGAQSLVFELSEVDSGLIELRCQVADHLAADDAAWLVMSPPRRARVLLVTPGNPPLEVALSTGKARQLVDAEVQPPAHLDSDAWREQTATGRYDLVIFDRCRPPAAPQAHAVYVGRLPPGEGWRALAPVDVPQIIDTERAHPLMQLVELGDVLLAEATPLEPPAGHLRLIDTNRGTIMAIAPRERFEDLVLGFELLAEDRPTTNWPLRQSFPVFVMNLVEYFGARQAGPASGSLRTGQSLVLPLETSDDNVLLVGPTGRTARLPRGSRGEFHVPATSQVGVYELRDGQGTSARLAVNLFDATESQLVPAETIKAGHVEVAAQRNWAPARRDAWKLFLLAALAVLLFEWYIYNRRVYI